MTHRPMLTAAQSGMRAIAMRWVTCVLVTMGLLACAGCDAKGSANGGGTGNSAHGLAKIGLPF